MGPEELEELPSTSSELGQWLWPPQEAILFSQWYPLQAYNHYIAFSSTWSKRTDNSLPVSTDHLGMHYVCSPDFQGLVMRKYKVAGRPYVRDGPGVLNMIECERYGFLLDRLLTIVTTTNPVLRMSTRPPITELRPDNAYARMLENAMKPRVRIRLRRLVTGYFERTYLSRKYKEALALLRRALLQNDI